MSSTDPAAIDPEALIISSDLEHPSNLIPALCKAFYNLGWVTGTGGGTSIRHGPHIYIAPSGVQKEKIQPKDMFVLDYATRTYLRRPEILKPSACTPLFLAAFDRGAGCCIHTHSQWAVLVTLLVERDTKQSVNGGDRRAGGAEMEGAAGVFEIEEIEQIKGIGRGRGKEGSLGYFERLRMPIIENTAQ
ncbi:MAG: Methylthioribulose-1-phosphate dehydratase [Stictis urceolatum]|nr:Methylthioribulose-1-phosphate dehydratase [Stictis urceolata]